MGSERQDEKQDNVLLQGPGATGPNKYCWEVGESECQEQAVELVTNWWGSQFADVENLWNWFSNQATNQEQDGSFKETCQHLTL